MVGLSLNSSLMSARKRFKQSKLTSFLAVNDEESYSVHQTGASTAGNRSGSADNDNKDVPVTSDEILDEFAKSDRKILL